MAACSEVRSGIGQLGVGFYSKVSGSEGSEANAQSYCFQAPCFESYLQDLATVVHSSSFFKLVSNGWVNG